MRIAKIESLHCNAGWRDFSFLKITTGDGLAGWSEYMENFGAEGLSFVLDRLGERLIGMDPRPVEKITAFPQGAGPGVGLHLDPNFNFKTEGYIRLAQALEPFDLVWLEVDSYDPDALATIGCARIRRCVR